MSVIPTVWCPYCDSANELNAKRCWHCKQRIPVEAVRTATDETMATLPALPAATGLPASAGLPAPVSAHYLRHALTAAYPMTPLATIRAYAAEAEAEEERKQCVYCREWINPEASVCPFCRTDQGTIAAVQRATWSFVQLFLCFAAVGIGLAVLIRICQWGLTGGAASG
jgi:hypothetical protein